MKFSSMREDTFSKCLHECKDPTELNMMLSSLINQKDEVERKLKGVLHRRANRPANRLQHQLQGDFVKLTRFTEIACSRINSMGSTPSTSRGTA